MIRVLILAVLICFGCQTGRLPCPKFKTSKATYHKHYRNYSSTLTAKADEKEVETKTKKPAGRYVQNISVEEWDCPQPGSKKYMPRNVKDNIRRNARRIQTDLQESSTDSTSVE